MLPKKISLLLVVVVGLIAVYLMTDVRQLFTLEYLSAQQERFQSYYQHHRVATLLIYAGIYMLTTALSIPGATVLTLAGGAVFGFVMGTVVVSITSTIGATLAFLSCRYLFREAFQKRFKSKLAAINTGVKREGAFYLFAIRLAPGFPFFIVNVAMAKTYLKTSTFMWVSQLGMLPGTMVYVNAGTRLRQIHSLNDIIDPGLLVSFLLLGIFPLLAKWSVTAYRRRKRQRPYRKPKKYDYNVVVLGAGSGGLVVAYIAATLRAKVALVEKDKMGGDCLNTGCVPSKAFLRSAKVLREARQAEAWGFTSATIDFDFAQVMERVQNIIQRVAPHDSEERYRALGVEVFKDDAKLLDPYRVKVQDKILTAKNVVIATGARPLLPPIPGLEEVQPLTSKTVWNIRELPPRLVVVGGGPIGCELAQAFARFGSQVTLIEGMSRLLLKEDPEVSELIKTRFKEEGITVLTGHMVEAFQAQQDQKVVICNCDGQEIHIECDEILMALGRKANVKGFGLEELGVELRSDGTIEVDEFLRTNYPNIYAVGDVTGPYQFTHAASHQAWYASVNSLFSPLKKFKVDYRVMPWTTFTDPEVARVGLNETEAQEQGVPYEVTHYDLADLDRAITDGADSGFVKVLTPPGKDTLLGVTIVGAHAGETLAEFVLAMKHGIGLNKILGTIHTYPTFSEANKFAAGNWKKAHAPERILNWLKTFHAWRRK
jgi:dihydrolipoamide dehydrogenase